MAHLDDLYHLGQSTWLNYLRRAFIESGELKEAINDGVTGITSTPLIFEKAITSSADYDKAIRELVARGKPVKEIYEALVTDDIQRTADVLHPVFEMSGGLEGYVTLELNPSFAHDTFGTVAEARHILHEVDRPNAMIEIPATEAGITAMEMLLHDGVNVNATHIFSLEIYQKVAKAYLQGIEMYIHSHSVWRQNPASVASFSLSRIDRMVDQLLDERDRPDLKKITAMAIAKVAYQTFLRSFSGSSWQRLVRRGAFVQRLKWTRTNPMNYDYPDNYYVEGLSGPDTVVTMSPTTLSAYRNHGEPAARLLQGVDNARAHLAELQDLGIDLERIGQDLQVQSLAAFSSYFQSLIGSVITKRDQLDHDWQGFEPYLGPFEREVVSALAKFCEDRTLCQIWAGDHTVWNSEPEEIANRLGWMHSIETMQENTNRLKELVRSVLASNGSSGSFTDVMVLGMGGSSLAAQLFGSIFSNRTRPLDNQANYPVVSVLDTTDPDDISTLSNGLDMERTLFIVSSKSGKTLETISSFKYFYNLVADSVGLDAVGDRFVAISDPGTALVDIATRLRFRELFLNAPNIGGRYSALSYFGLVPAALAGVDVDRLLDRAFSMACNAHSCNCPMKGDNIAAQFGVILGNMALAGRDKLTVITSPSIAAFAGWAEQLIAESTGKDGKGILPVVGETIMSADSYGDDRLFVYVRLDADGVFDLDVQTLIEASHPVVTFHLRDQYDIGGLFFTWEMATAVAGNLMEVNPFDQPNVEEAKVLAQKIMSEYRRSGFVPDDELGKPSARALHEFLDRVRPGDYIAIQAYLRRSADTDASLHELRTKILDHYRVATTVGYGPRYLHSTGQLHKGDGGNGLFIQLTADPEVNIPIPNEAGKPQSDISFGQLIHAQAHGDARALRNRGRRLIRFHLGKDILGGLEKLRGKKIYA